MDHLTRRDCPRTREVRLTFVADVLQSWRAVRPDPGRGLCATRSPTLQFCLEFRDLSGLSLDLRAQTRILSKNLIAVRDDLLQHTT